jgi:hypothetical protein
MMSDISPDTTPGAAPSLQAPTEDLHRDAMLDQALQDSFPASDPPGLAATLAS